MTFLIIYLVSVLFNFFVVCPLATKYLDRTSVKDDDIGSFIILSLLTVILTIIVCILILFKDSDFSISNFLNKLWRIK